MKSIAVALLVVLGGLGALALTPRPCAACSPPPPTGEVLELRFQSRSVDGEVQPDPQGYGSLQGTLEVLPYGEGHLLRLVRGTDVVVEATFR